MPTYSNKTSADRAQRADELLRQADRLDDAKQYRKAFALFLESAMLGDTGAQVNVGNYYAAGRGTGKNLAEAERWYRKAYQAGDSGGANNLACDKRDAKNYRAAVLWFKKAIALDDGDAAVELAKMHLKRKQTKQAIAALETALSMDSLHTSEYGREEAVRILEQLQP